MKHVITMSLLSGGILFGIQDLSRADGCHVYGPPVVYHAPPVYYAPAVYYAPRVSYYAPAPYYSYYGVYRRPTFTYRERAGYGGRYRSRYRWRW